MTATRTRRLVLILCLFSLGVAALFLLDVVPFLRGGFGWQWPYQLASAGRALMAIGAIGLYGVGLWFLARRRARDRWWVAWSFLAAIGLAAAALAVRASAAPEHLPTINDVTYELFTRTVSPMTTGVHALVARMDWTGDAWRDWPAIMERYNGQIAHVSLAPPGLPLLQWLINRALESIPGVSRAAQLALLPYQCQNYDLLAYQPSEWASALFGMLLPVWAALGVFPLYAAARRSAVPGAARLSAALFPLVPSLLAFSGTWNSIYPLVGALMLWALLRGLGGRRTDPWPFTGAGWYALAGGLTGLAILANFAFVPLILFSGWVVLLSWALVERRQPNADPWLAPIVRGGWYALGLSLPWVIYGAASGQTFFGLLATSLGMHLELDRPYLPWVWLHLWDWVLWTGLPLALVALAGLIAGWRRTDKRPVLALALALTIGILILSNFARGETGRVWMLFAPMLLIAAADGLIRLGGRWRWLLVAQAGWLLALLLTLVPVGTALSLPPAPPAAQSPGQRSGAEFGGLFRLDGWTATAGTDAIDLALTWTALAQSDRPYWFSALVVDGAGQPVGEALDWQPFDTRYPTTCWAPGTPLTDTVRLPLTPDARGPFWISLSAFGDDQGVERLPVILPDGTEDTQAGLGPVQ